MKSKTCSNKYVVGIDIGNSTTEVALAEISSLTGEIISFSSSFSETTGIKGTYNNIRGIKAAINVLCKKKGISDKEIALARINEATPVIGDFAMETITETVITESTMIGHNPDTPGGEGLGIGYTIYFDDLDNISSFDKPYILIIPGNLDFHQVASTINSQIKKGIQIKGAIMQNDDGVLVSNRLENIIPIIDEVKLLEKIPQDILCAVEVVSPGYNIKTLSNPYGIASVLKLTPKETKVVSVIAKALIGTRSAVVLKTPKGEIKERIIPAGEIIIEAHSKKYQVSINDGAEKIMETIQKAQNISNVDGVKGTAFGGMISQVKERFAELVGIVPDEVKIKDLFTVDSIVPQKVIGGLAEEYSRESAISIAVMVRTEISHMKELAEKFTIELKIPVEVAGIEADMAALGALTTPGVDKPFAIVDIGAGSTDACSYHENGTCESIHLAGAGDMVTMIINSELNLNDIEVAEKIKKYPLAKTESFYSIRHEDDIVEFFEQPLSGELYGRTLILADEGYIPIETKYNMGKIRNVRRNAKNKVLVQNIIRGLKKISPTGTLSAFDHVLLVGGSALDFELSNMATDALEKYGITAGEANILGSEGPRYAVATGLLLSMKNNE